VLVPRGGGPQIRREMVRDVVEVGSEGNGES